MANDAASGVALLPCPFCGGEPKRESDGQWWTTECTKCNCLMTEYLIDSPAEADAAWNRRATSGGAPREPSERERRAFEQRVYSLLRRAAISTADAHIFSEAIANDAWQTIASPARQGGEPVQVGCVTISEYVDSLPPEERALVEEVRPKVRAMLAAQPVQGEAVASARGYAHLGIGAYIINHSRAGEVPELCISLASEEDRRTRTVGDSVNNEPDSEVRADEMIVRLRFENAAGLGALETQLRLLREVHFPDPAPSAIEPAPDKVREPRFKTNQIGVCWHCGGRLLAGHNCDPARAALQGEQSPAPKCSDGWACTMPGDCQRVGHCISDAVDCAPAPTEQSPAAGVVAEPTTEMLVAGAAIYNYWAGHPDAQKVVSTIYAAMRKAAPRPEDAARLTDAERDVIAERKRQINVEGWTPNHDDDEHDGGDLATVAAHYAIDAAGQLNPYMQAAAGDYLPFDQDLNWPWERGWWKPGPARRNLVKAGALILAEIERIDRAALQGEQAPDKGSAGKSSAEATGLVERLCTHWHGSFDQTEKRCEICHEAAAHIEQLERERDEFYRDSMSATRNADAQQKRAEQSEARLAEVIEAGEQKQKDIMKLEWAEGRGSYTEKNEAWEKVLDFSAWDNVIKENT